MAYYLLLYYSALYFLFASIVFCGILLLIAGEHIASKLEPYSPHFPKYPNSSTTSDIVPSHTPHMRLPHLCD